MSSTCIIQLPSDFEDRYTQYRSGHEKQGAQIQANPNAGSLDYLPEWKIYLWKKLLLNKEGFDRANVVVGNFMFFSDEEQMQLMAGKTQRMIGAVQQAHGLVAARRKAAQIDTTNHQSLDDDYYSCHPVRIMGALVELMDSNPRILSITARLDKRYIAWYRQEKKKYEALQYRKHLAGLGGRGATPYKPDDSYMNDPLCGLSKSVYEKTENGQTLTSDEFRGLAGFGGQSIHDYIVLELKINKPALQARMDAYLDGFAAGNLTPPLGVMYFDPSLQRKNIYSSIQATTASFGTKNLPITSERIAQYGGWTVGDEKHYRIFETLFSLEKTGEIEISNLRGNEIVISLVDKSATEKPAVEGKSKGAFDLEKEKAKIAAIKFVSDFKTAKKKWFNVKSIIDAIHRKLPPVEDVDGIVIRPITLDHESLTAEQKEMLLYVLKHAYNNGAISYLSETSSVVITSEPARKFLNGENILIENLDKFDDYREKINGLCDFIEQEAKNRFPETNQDSGTSRPVKEGVAADEKNKAPTTEAGKDGLGYLLFHDEKIPIGESSSGKFKLAETLCGQSFGKARTIETVFESVKPEKDKNKIDGDLTNSYMNKGRKLDLLKNQVREINRAIAGYAKQKKLKQFKYRISLKADTKTQPRTVWLEEIVGRRG